MLRDVMAETAEMAEMVETEITVPMATGMAAIGITATGMVAV